ncbi:MAG TPA: hypothetical protein VGE01_04015, partial [Fimbriimonas sp.]
SMSRKALFTCVTLTVCALAVAKVSFVKDFQGTYDIKKTSALGKANCAVCHTKGPKLNAYGVDLQNAMTRENTKVLTGSVLKKVEGLDSDKDGKTNLVEIRGGTLPGDNKSK